MRLPTTILPYLLLATVAAGDSADATLIRQSDIPMVIAAPGMYRIAEDLQSPADSIAITIAADDVSIDLGGHRIAGPGRLADQQASAIGHVGETPNHEVVVFNGTIEGFPTSAIGLGDVSHATIRDLHIRDIGEIAIDVGDDTTVRANQITSIGFDTPTRTGAIIGIRAGLNSTIEQNVITGMHHGGLGHLDGIRVERGCFVVDNRIEDLTTIASGTGDVIAIACSTMAADIRANKIANVTNNRPGGIAIGVRLGSGSSEMNRVRNVSAASMAIGIQGIAAVFIERNEIEGVRAISGGPDAYGIMAAGTGGRVTGNTVAGVDSGSDEKRNREVGIRANSAFEVAGNTVRLPHVRMLAHQAGIEISGRYNVIVENTIRLGDASGLGGVAVLLGPLTLSNTVGGNETNGRYVDKGAGNITPGSPGEGPAI